MISSFSLESISEILIASTSTNLKFRSLFLLKFFFFAYEIALTLIIAQDVTPINPAMILISGALWKVTSVCLITTRIRVIYSVGIVDLTKQVDFFVSIVFPLKD